MSSFTSSIDNLKKAVAIAEQIERLEGELKAVLSGTAIIVTPEPASTPTTKRGSKRKMSAATIAKMRASQKARWAKKEVVLAVDTVVKATEKPVKKAKRKLSDLGRARIVAALKARWAQKKGAAMEKATPKAKPVKKK